MQNKIDNFIELVFLPLLYSLIGGYLYTPIGFPLDKNALTTTTHLGNIPYHPRLVCHSESPPTSGSPRPGEPDRPCPMSPPDRPSGSK